MTQNTVSSEQIWEAFREHRKESERKLLAFQRRETAENDVKNDGEESLDMQDQLVAAEKRRSLPLELLAEEWLREECGDVATKTYLIDNLLPTLILGLEKLLTEVSNVPHDVQDIFPHIQSQYVHVPLSPTGIGERTGRY